MPTELIPESRPRTSRAPDRGASLGASQLERSKGSQAGSLTTSRGFARLCACLSRPAGRPRRLWTPVTRTNRRVRQAGRGYLPFSGLGSSLSSMPRLQRRVTTAASRQPALFRASSAGNSTSRRVLSGNDSGSTQTNRREGAKPRALQRALRRPSLWSRISVPTAARQKMKGSWSAVFLREPDPGEMWERDRLSTA